MLSRRLIRRVLIVPPAGLVGNWEREMRTLFRLPFRIVSGGDARAGNPFLGPESDQVIVSIDTLTGERMFGHLKDAQTNAYDLVVFDEAHKLSADRQPDFRVRKTDRYKLAEALAGAEIEDDRWELPWSAQHLLLLTVTPHTGKDYPYYFLWRLLLPDALSTYDAFGDFPRESRERHFIRRTKEEMVRFDGSPLYSQRNCATLSYALSQGPESEQELYDETTEYLQHHYNRAKMLNRSAARLGLSMRDYLEQAITGDADSIAECLEGDLTEQQVQALAERERMLFGEGGEVQQRLAHLNDEAEQENYRRLLPGYVRRFVERAAPLLDLRIEGDLGATFALDALLPTLEVYSEEVRERLTVYKPTDHESAVWLHPGEPVFDGLSATILSRFGRDGLKGAVFTDPYATEAYLFHIALIAVEQRSQDTPQPLESRLIGLRQSSDGTLKECPVEQKLLLRGAHGFAPSRVPLATLARGMIADADRFVREEVSERVVQAHRQRRLDDLPARLEFVNRGFGFQAAELAAVRSHLSKMVRAGDHHAQREFSKVKERQRNLTASRNHRLAELQAEPDLIQAGEIEFLVHALVVPTQDAEEAEHYDADVEAIAVEVATDYEKRFGAEVQDVSRPELARRAGLTDWPGFDLLSRRAEGERRAIEVKGRASTGGIELSENEWAKACNLRDEYWLYVVFDCATPHPRLVRVRDPFAKLLVRSRESIAYIINLGDVIEAAERLHESNS